VCELRSLGYHEIRLVGHSDLDFIIENGCRMAGIAFSRAEDGSAPACNDTGLFTMYSENNGRNQTDLSEQGHAAFLQEIVSGTWKGDGRA
jgi:tartrate dehydratase alpha subunit/fumarate hydratase class I-like protein